MSEIFPFERSCTLFFPFITLQILCCRRQISLDNKENTSYSLTQFLPTNLVFLQNALTNVKSSSVHVKFSSHSSEESL